VIVIPLPIDAAVVRKQLRKVTAVMVLGAFIAACTTTHPIDIGAPAALTEEVHPGDKVAITTRDGRKFAFEVVRVEDDAIIGATERVQQDEIAQLEVTRFSEGRTAGLVLGGVLLILGAVTALFIAPILAFHAPAVTL
jgi:hypothetical protein